MPELFKKTQNGTFVVELYTRLPILITAADYHYFDDYADLLKKISPRLKCKEVGFSEGGGYVAVVYLDKKPTRKQLSVLWEAYGFAQEEE